jgi:hypothetical protein
MVSGGGRQSVKRLDRGFAILQNLGHRGNRVRDFHGWLLRGIPAAQQYSKTLMLKMPEPRGFAILQNLGHRGTRDAFLKSLLTDLHVGQQKANY